MAPTAQASRLVIDYRNATDAVVGESDTGRGAVCRGDDARPHLHPRQATLQPHPHPSQPRDGLTARCALLPKCGSSEQLTLPGCCRPAPSVDC